MIMAAVGGGEEVNVVVTGFDSWCTDPESPNRPVNPSWLIADALPRIIHREGKPNIRVIVYPKPVPVSWSSVQTLVPKLWTGHKAVYDDSVASNQAASFPIHAMLHIGMIATPEQTFRLERQSVKTTSEHKDVNGQTPSHDDKDGGGRWADAANKLITKFDVIHIQDQVLSALPDSSCLISGDPGMFLCGYIYWCSMAEATRQKQDRPVLFLHVPSEHESSHVERGKQLATVVIESMVEQMESRVRAV